jgi:hypothetical protein
VSYILFAFSVPFLLNDDKSVDSIFGDPTCDGYESKFALNSTLSMCDCVDIKKKSVPNWNTNYKKYFLKIQLIDL